MAAGVKLKPIADNLAFFNDGYRGEHHIAWDLVYKKGRAFELYGTWCERCKQAWGWSPLLSQVRTLYKAMRVHGCPRCKAKPKSLVKSK